MLFYQNIFKYGKLIAMEKIIGLVVTYYPEAEIICNIDTYLPYISELIIVDNTPEKSSVISELTKKWENEKSITIEFNNQNLGIAKALNQGAEIAISKGYEWMLTMDQDSTFFDSIFFEKFKNINKHNLAIFAPGNNASNNTIKLNDEVTNVQIVMTSGNIVSLKCWKEIGGFKENLFIDEVDHDFCLRLKLKNYYILQYNKAILNHSLGDSKHISILSFKRQLFLHSHVRTYYIIRNNLYMFKLYSKHFPKLMQQRKSILFKDLIKILLFSNNKTKHIKFAKDGFVDYQKNLFGENRRF